MQAARIDQKYAKEYIENIDSVFVGLAITFIFKWFLGF